MESNQIKQGKKSMEYKVWACEKCQKECAVAGTDATAEGKAQNVIVICPQCLSAIKMSIDDYNKSMKL